MKGEDGIHNFSPRPRPPYSQRFPSGDRQVLEAKHRRMVRLQHLSVPQIHMYAAWETRIETPDSAHDVDALELVRPVFFKDRRVLNRVFVGSRRALAISRGFAFHGVGGYGW